MMGADLQQVKDQLGRLWAASRDGRFCAGYVALSSSWCVDPADRWGRTGSVLGLTPGREPLDDKETNAAAGTGAWQCASVIGRWLTTAVLA